jgi:imidazoleglycerol phosphate synthase glutamine amidotransferase subunit HisH
MMRSLDELDVRGALIETIHRGVPFLGICLGMQALFTSGEEAPEERGLGIYPGEVKRFQGDMRIPHMGWNQLERVRESNATAATCDYSLPYTAVLEHNNVYGVQFHPEKSGDLGLKIVRNFVES